VGYGGRSWGTRFSNDPGGAAIQLAVDGHIQRRMRAAAASVPEARAVIRAVAERCGASPETVEDIALAVTEAAANVVRHAYPSDPLGVFDLETHLEGGDFVIRLRDYGAGHTAQAETEGLGIGLIVMEKLADACMIEECAPGTVITLRFHVSRGL
jgi:serine/threonine-protein kinase RsbW